jgi:hypothetical protein
MKRNWIGRNNKGTTTIGWHLTRFRVEALIIPIAIYDDEFISPASSVRQLWDKFVHNLLNSY